MDLFFASEELLRGSEQSAKGVPGDPVDNDHKAYLLQLNINTVSKCTSICIYIYTCITHVHVHIYRCISYIHIYMCISVYHIYIYIYVYICARPALEGMTSWFQGGGCTALLNSSRETVGRVLQPSDQMKARNWGHIPYSRLRKVGTWV